MSEDYPTIKHENKKYLMVPQLANDNCAMCVGKHRDCRELPRCVGVIFIKRSQLPEYHVRYLAERWAS